MLTLTVLAQDSNAPVKLKPTIVTGSFIPTAETVGVAPVETITSVQIEQTGAQDVLELLKKVSTSFAGSGNLGQTLNNGGFGEANVGIRNLPTLVLLDGRRLAGSAFSALFNGGNSVDLNTVPISMIDRVEVLKDGASVAYGSDAIGGVVNIITKKDWNGVEVSGRYGFTTEDGAKYTEHRAAIVAGAANETTRFVGGIQYFNSDPLLSQDRHVASAGILDLARIGMNPPSYVSPSYPGRVDSFILAGSPIAIGAPGYNPAITTPIVDPGVRYATIADYNAAHPGIYIPLGSTPLGAQLDAAGVGNYPLLNTTLLGTHSIQSQDRKNVLANIEHDVFEKKLQLFGSFFYASTESVGELAPSPVSSLAVNNISVPSNNIYNPFQEPLGVGASGDPHVRSRFIETGNRIFDSHTEYYRFVGGLKGEFENGWGYEGAYDYNRSEQIQFTRNAVNGAALNAALTPNSDTNLAALGLSQLTDANGNALPQYNIFAIPNSGNNSNSTLSRLKTTLFNSGVSEDWTFDARAHGSIFQLPGGPLQLAVGGDYRSEHLSLDTDGLTALGLVPGLSPASPFPGGRRDEYAGWAEVNIPLFSPDMHVPAFYSFEISAAGRIEELSPGGESLVPKVGFRWQPIDNQLTFRGEYSQGFIAPTLFNLFGPTRVSNPTVSVGSDSGQVTTFLPTNPNLPPSTSENFTLGVIYSPKQIPGLTLSADWYRVVQEGIAFNPDANSIVANLNANGSASPYASGFRFTDNSQLTSPAPNQIGLTNFGTLVIPTLPGAMQKTDGLDLSANYRRPTEQMGIFNFWANANVLFGYYFQAGPGQPAHQFAGYFTDPQVAAGFQGTLPDFIITTGMSWEFMGFTASANARYIPEVRDSGTRFPTAGGSASNDFTVNGKDWIVDSYYTVDMQLAYRFTSKFGPWLRDLRLAVGVNNITDNIAPFIASSSEDNTDKSTYDILGRFVYFEVSKKF